MRYRMICLFIIFCSVFVHFEPIAFADDKNPDKRLNDSIYQFLSDFYKDLKLGNPQKVRQYFLKIDKRRLDYLIRINKVYEVEKIDLEEVAIHSQEPLIVEVTVREWYKPKSYPFPYQDFIYNLKKIGKYKWKIVEISEPGLP